MSTIMIFDGTVVDPDGKDVSEEKAAQIQDKIIEVVEGLGLIIGGSFAMTKNISSIHDLKTWPVYFEAVIAGDKTFEIRKDDRGFKVGDLLRLREYDPNTKQYTGRATHKEVSYITGYGQPEGQVVLGFEK